MHTPLTSVAANARLLCQAFAAPQRTPPLPQPGDNPFAAGPPPNAASLPVTEHRREWLFALGASALISATAEGQAEDLRGLIRERVTAGLTLADAVRPALLLDWVRGELFFGLPLDPDEGRRFLLAAADALRSAADAGEVVPDDGWAVLRRGSRRPPPGPETVRAAGGEHTPTAPAGQLTLDEQVARLADLADPRVAAWHELSVVCGQASEGLAELYDVAPADIDSALHAAREFLRKSQVVK